MSILIKAAHIIDPNGPHHDEVMDILIESGTITNIGRNLSASNATIIDHPGQYLSIGWMDVGTRTGDPGFEQREDSTSLAQAAARGGYTHLAILPNTMPVVDGKAEVTYLRNQSRPHPVQFHPIGALSLATQGKEITEMIDMHQAGAIAFGDGDHPVQHAGLMLRALHYAQTFGGIIINSPLDQSIASRGHMHEGEISTQLGLKAIPDLAEELMVARDLQLLAYTGGRLLIHQISTAGAVDRIRQAKKDGLQVSASVAAMNLVFTDEALQGFDPNFKLMPPLRSEQDRQALLAAVQDGTIDFITSNHSPLEPEQADIEFFYADFGCVGLSTTFSLLRSKLQDLLSLEQLINLIASNPRRVFNLDLPQIDKGSRVDLTLFLPDQERIIDTKEIASKSKNSPLIGASLPGKVLHTFFHERKS